MNKTGEGFALPFCFQWLVFGIAIPTVANLLPATLTSRRSALPYPRLDQTAFFAFLPKDRLAAELDAVAIDTQHLHHQLVAYAQLILQILNPMFGNLSDVHQGVHAGKNLEKCAEFNQAHNRSQIVLSYLRFQRPDMPDVLQVASAANAIDLLSKAS